MEEVNKKVEKESEEIERKYKAKKRVRGLLIGINVVLIGYLIFNVGSLIVDKITRNDSNYINLYDTSKRDSQKMYDEYLLSNEEVYITTDLFDYGIYGDYLHLSRNKIIASNYSSIDSTYIRRVKYFKEKFDVAYDSNNNFLFNKNYLDGGLRLSSLSEGEYFLFDDYVMESNYSEKHCAFKIRSSEMIYKTIYTLPDNTGIRKRIDVKSIDSSPCLVISINEVESIASNYYDFVFIGDDVETYKQQIDSKYKIYHAKDLLDAYLVNSSYCFVLDDSVNSVTGSSYIKNQAVTKGELYGGSSLISNQDKNDYIRELGGYLTNAGTCVLEEETSFEIAPYKSENDIGKYTLLFNNQVSFNTILDIIK